MWGQLLSATQEISPWKEEKKMNFFKQLKKNHQGFTHVKGHVHLSSEMRHGKWMSPQCADPMERCKWALTGMNALPFLCKKNLLGLHVKPLASYVCAAYCIRLHSHLIAGGIAAIPPPFQIERRKACVCSSLGLHTLRLHSRVIAASDFKSLQSTGRVCDAIAS